MPFSQPTGAFPYVDGIGALMTVDYVLANWPANANNRGKYARVSDYGGYVDRLLRCDWDSGINLYFWQPTQTDYARQLAVTADTTILALKHPNSLILTGSIPTLTTRNITFDLANRRPGEVIEVRNSMSSLLGTLNLLGTGIGTLVFNTLGGYSRMVVDYSTGSPQLVKQV